MEAHIEDKVHSVNRATTTAVMEPLSAEDRVRGPRSSTSEILTTKSSAKKLPLRVACWNVRTMLQPGKLENAKQEMLKMNINILGISETRWPGNNTFIAMDSGSFSQMEKKAKEEWR